MTIVKEKEKIKMEDVPQTVALLDEDVKKDVKDPYAPPDGGWGWVVMVCAFICCLVLDGICYVFGVFLEPLMEDFKVDNATMSAVGSVLSGVIQLVGPFVALLVNLLGMRIVCIIGAVISSAGFFFATFVTDVWLLMVLLGIVAGTGLGLMYVPAVVSVGYYFDKRRALATGVVCSGSGAGTFILAPFASFLLIQLGGWRGAMRVFAGLCLFCVLCGFCFRPLKKKPKKLEGEDSEGGEEGEGKAQEKTNCLRTIVDESCSPKLLTNLPFMLLCFSNLFATQGLYIPYMFLPSLAKSQGISKVNASFLISIVGICNTICRILSGMLTDLPGVSALVVTFIALGVGGIAPLAMPFCDEYWAFVIVSVMFGAFLSAWCAVTSPAIVEMCGLDLLTSGFGTLTFVRGFAALIGPPIAGWLVDYTGNKENAFYLSAALLFTSALVCVFAWLAQKAKERRGNRA